MSSDDFGMAQIDSGSFRLAQIRSDSLRVGLNTDGCSEYMLSAMLTTATVGALAGGSTATIAKTKLKAVLFDLDGTLFDSDGLHLAVFQDVLQEYKFNDGEKIDTDFFKKRIAGRQNKLICEDLFNIIVEIQQK